MSPRPADETAQTDEVVGAVEPEGAAAPASPGGALFWAGLGLGWAIMAFGVWGAIRESDWTRPPELATWVLGAAVAHDGLVAPLVAVVGVLAAGVLPRWARGPVRGALALSAIVVLFSYPALRGFGARDGNPSILPLDYERNVALVVGGVWVVALAMLVWRWRRPRPEPPADHPT